jgi:hypothetical protein
MSKDASNKYHPRNLIFLRLAKKNPTQGSQMVDPKTSVNKLKYRIYNLEYYQYFISRTFSITYNTCGMCRAASWALLSPTTIEPLIYRNTKNPLISKMYP